MDSRTFNAAAKHLFRHLHDPHALRKNPLVGHLFREVTPPELASVLEDRIVLATIHKQVRVGSDRCRQAYAKPGNNERAARSHAIIIQQCLGKRSYERSRRNLGFRIITAIASAQKSAGA
jgi:hypothetical protein